MDQFNKRMEEMKQAYQSIEVPESSKERLIFAMKKAQNDKKQKRSAFLCRMGGVAAALVLLFALPNSNANVAQALGDLPVVGGLFRIVTIRDYQYESEHNNANVEIPEIQDEDGSSQAAAQVNKSVEEYANQLIEEFQSGVEEFGDEGYSDLDVGYDVITNNDDWLTLKLWTLQVAGSGYETAKFYNIDKAADEVVPLSGLFREDSGYISVISENIKEQMRQRMDEDKNLVYWLDSDIPEWDFEEISQDQNYYFNEDGDLVIFFDEYEVAPGYMGTVEFTIERAVFESLLK